MPPFLLWAVGALAGAAAVKFAVREARRINEELDSVRPQPGEPSPAPIRRLKRDPRTGTYRPE